MKSKNLKTSILACVAKVASFAAITLQKAKGVVTDESGTQLRCVVVLMSGTSIITNIDGYHSFEMEAGVTSVFPFSVLMTNRIELARRNTINISVLSDRGVNRKL